MKQRSGMIRFVNWLLVIASAVLLFAVISVSGNRHGREPRYASFRAEGLSLREAAPSALKYVRKYYHKRWDAPDTIVQFYSRQAAMSRLIRDTQPERAEQISIAFTGDIMWIRNGWDSFLDERLRLHLSGYDIVFGNLETPIDTTAKVTSFLPDYAKYNSAPGLIRSFRRDDGTNIFTALSLANNHAFDMGSEGLAQTVRFLGDEGIGATGAATALPYAGHGRTGAAGTIDTVVSADGAREGTLKEYLLFKQGDLRVGFYAAGWGLNDPKAITDKKIRMNIIPGIAPLNPDRINLDGLTEVLAKMKADSIDIKILFLHWGYEFELYPDTEIIKAGRALAAAGADMVIGSHPHVIQPTEICLFNGYKLPGTDDAEQKYFHSTDSEGVPRKALIIYSLGNFTTAMYTPLCRLGLVSSVTVWRDKDNGRFDWSQAENLFVYNETAGWRGSKRRLMKYDDYIGELREKSPRRAARLSRQMEAVFELSGR
jgi:poly-gamma-glutamate capsule biosynthesis protein CapA/YwtB (metallophosphatase superfamily)